MTTTERPSRMSADRTTSSGPRAAGNPAASRPSKGTRSCTGTSSGARCGTTSASPTRRVARISSPPAGHANEIYREVWKKEPPIGLVHEFFTTSGGKKMSTSKGLGAAASELVAIYPPELVRFLMLRTHPKRHVEFDPAGLTLLKLMDEYDQGGDAFLTEPESDKAKTWLLSQVAEDPEPPGFRVRFSIVADWLQIPSVDPRGEAEERKAAPLNPSEQRDLDRRVALARVWLERWAPDEARFSVLSELPAITLTDAQRRYLESVKQLVGTTSDPEALQQELYETAKGVGLVVDGKVSRDAFSAIYLAFLGRPSGPKAGWLLRALDDDFVRRRLDEAVKAR